MKRLIAVISTIAICVIGSVFTPNVEAQSLYTNVKKSTVFIASYDYMGELLSRGSGFFVDEGIIITNIHVIDGYARYYRIFATDDNDSLDPYCYREINRSDIKINLDDDVAYLRAFLDCPHGSVFFADSDPKVGEAIGIFGYPAIGGDFFSSFDLVYTVGSVLAKTKGGIIPGETEGPWLYTDAPINGGNSGGPVVQDGKVVGIAVAAHEDKNGNSIDGFFIPVSEIKRGLESANNSTFAYTPQESQENQVYIEYEESQKEPVERDPFNPILAAGRIATKGDCLASVGEGADSTGYSKQEGDACKCKKSYHKDAAGTKCLPGSHELAMETEQYLKLKVDDGFSDVDIEHPYINAIKWGKKSGVLSGYPDGSFRPSNLVNRVEFLKIILEATESDFTYINSPSGFPDVDEHAWYAPYVRYAKMYGIIDGYPDGTFQPEKTVNFAEALKIAYKTLDTSTEDSGDEWYSRYLNHAKRNSILFTNDVDIGGDVSRQDVVWIVWKLLFF